MVNDAPAEPPVPPIQPAIRQNSCCSSLKHAAPDVSVRRRRTTSRPLHPTESVSHITPPISRSHAPAVLPLAAHAQQRGGSNGMEIEVTDPATGVRRRMSITQAITAGVVTVRRDGHLTIPATSRHRGVRAVPVGTQATPATSPPSSDSMAARIGRVNRALGKYSRWPMLATSALRIAQAPGAPAWQTMYFAANGLNRVLGGSWLPSWLTNGPVKVAIEGALLLPALQDSFDALSGARPAAHGASTGHHGIGPQPAVSAASVASTAASAARPNVPALAPLFTLIKPMYRVGMTMACLTGVLALPEYLAEHGTDGLMSTTSGRSAWIGAISSAAMLAAMWIPASPLQLYADAASNVLWGAELVNGHGWLDGLLGSDGRASAASHHA